MAIPNLKSLNSHQAHTGTAWHHLAIGKENYPGTQEGTLDGIDLGGMSRKRAGFAFQALDGWQ